MRAAATIDDSAPSGARARRWAWLALLRPQQWIKNVLLFAPLAAQHRLFDLLQVGRCLLAFAAFCLAASSIYIFNDLLDVEADRRHPQTAGRPIASRQVGVGFAIAMQCALLAAAAVLAALLPVPYRWVLAAYYIAMCLYSLVLKHVVVLDILILSAGYSLRVAAGAFALDVPVSPSLIAMCGAAFLSLALLKRYVSLASIGAFPGADAHARSYRAHDAPVLAMQGIASGYIAVLVLALYSGSEAAQRLYSHPRAIWLVCVLLVYWFNYIWLMARRGAIPHDPVAFALRDRTSGLLIAGMAVAAILAV